MLKFFVSFWIFCESFLFAAATTGASKEEFESKAHMVDELFQAPKPVNFINIEVKIEDRVPEVIAHLHRLRKYLTILQPQKLLIALTELQELYKIYPMSLRPLFDSDRFLELCADLDGIGNIAYDCTRSSTERCEWCLDSILKPSAYTLLCCGTCFITTCKIGLCCRCPDYTPEYSGWGTRDHYADKCGADSYCCPSLRRQYTPEFFAIIDELTYYIDLQIAAISGI
jgi:hypothetical protein